eukprot:CAMPEP_0118863758 /NCGR_PEP_ID=MMETSP1163-20130328/8517_1 /TAXON_ID=124430 /ORGANISM="Phaeomonas parva, Strain CCMP2877" /LENGTH=31 /DNA_ID= /DNA_START= /DNA_END= /DNA_ORIENTATION=
MSLKGHQEFKRKMSMLSLMPRDNTDSRVADL